MIEGLFRESGIDVLERTVQFAGQRHRLIVNNIANLSTPNYRPTDVDAGAFRESMAKALGRRRATHPGLRSETPIRPKDTADIEFTNHGMHFKPRPTGRGILFHDRNDRDLEGLMAELAENTLTHRTATELLRARFATLQTAIRERV
ncbi:MAG: hypothetical protein IT430_13375 [Phycisphaerales bacterium]|nr:hypothetical protein [Phycisphaerales bacterium]